MPGLMFPLNAFSKKMDNYYHLFRCGMENAGWRSAGWLSGDIETTDVVQAIKEYGQASDVVPVLLWPRFNWDWGLSRRKDVTQHDCLTNWEYLVENDRVLRVTILHDAGTLMEQQKEWLEQFKPNVVLTWYHDKSIRECGWDVDAYDIIRTWHSVDPASVPTFSNRNGIGCISGVECKEYYPMRHNVMKAIQGDYHMRNVEHIRHPSYRLDGPRHAEYMRELAKYRVAVCTASAFKFALRKIFEATAAGCVVVTDLPEYDRLPEIDGNLYRVHSTMHPREVAQLCRDLAAKWDFERQKYYSQRVVERYNYNVLAQDVSDAISNRAKQWSKQSTS